MNLVHNRKKRKKRIVRRKYTRTSGYHFSHGGGSPNVRVLGFFLFHPFLLPPDTCPKRLLRFFFGFFFFVCSFLRGSPGGFEAKSRIARNIYVSWKITFSRAWSNCFSCAFRKWRRKFGGNTWEKRIFEFSNSWVFEFVNFRILEFRIFKVLNS